MTLTNQRNTITVMQRDNKSELSIAYCKSKPHVIEALEEYVKAKKCGFSDPKMPAEKLRQFLETSQDLKQLDRALSGFNIFAALNVTDYENRHSDFLAWILDPCESHGQKDAFLRAFLSKVDDFQKNKKDFLRLLEADSPNAVNFNLETTRVMREFTQADKRRVDILLVNDSQQFVCVVENKVHTGDVRKRLTSYREQIEKDYPQYRKAFVFLTLRHEKPSDPNYLSIRYSDVLGLLRSVFPAKRRFAEPEAKAILFRHYLDFIQNHSANESGLNLLKILHPREIKHSDFWAWLFRPSENHGFGNIPLFELLRLVSNTAAPCSRTATQILSDIKCETRPIADISVVREVPGVKIDILVVSERFRFVIVVENKLLTKEGKGQLEKYRRYVDANFPRFRKFFVFFSLSGKSTGHGSYVSLAYADFEPFLCARISDLGKFQITQGEQVDMLIAQYRQLLERHLTIRKKDIVEHPPEISGYCANLLKTPECQSLLSKLWIWQEQTSDSLLDFLKNIAPEYLGDKTRLSPSNVNKVWLRFIPEEFFKEPLTGSSVNPTLWNSLAHYTFHNTPFGFDDVPYKSGSKAMEHGVYLTLGLAEAKEGWGALKQMIYRLASENEAVFNDAFRESAQEKVATEKFTTLLKIQLLSRDELIRLGIEGAKDLLRKRFNRFVKLQHPIVVKLFKNRAIRTFKP